MARSTTPSRRLWPVFAPFGALIVVAVAWSAFWYVAARRADATVTAWIEQEAKQGRIYGCGSRQSGGYPFRIEIRCSDPTVELTTAQPPRTLKAKDLVGVAQVYDPNLIIAEITGPLTIAEGGDPAAWRTDWRLAQASLRGIAGTPERLSVVLDEVRFERVDGANSETWAAARHTEFHLRRSPTSAPDKPVIDFAAQVAGASLPRAAMLAGKPLDAEVAALLRGLSDLRPKPVPARLKEWQAAGGRLEITKLRLQQGDAIALAAGDIGLSAAGRPDGAFNITMTGFDRLVQGLAGSGNEGGGVQLGLLAGLSFLGRPAEIDGKRAISIPLRLTDGTVFLGPLRVGKLEPLY